MAIKKCLGIMKNPRKEATVKTRILSAMNKRTFQRLYLLFIIVALVGASAHFTAGTAEAASPWQTILDAISGLDGKTDTIKNMVSGLQVSINVNERLCAECLCVQCGGSGHSYEAASSLNHNPVMITVLVTRMDGSEVDFLPSENFIFDAKIGPGPGIHRCGAPQDEVGCGPFTDSYFVATGNGVYTFVVHPSVTGFNWKPATYGFLLTVFDNDGNEGRALGEIVIDQ